MPTSRPSKNTARPTPTIAKPIAVPSQCSGTVWMIASWKNTITKIIGNKSLKDSFKSFKNEAILSILILIIILT